jgi:hypothetical protein
VAAMRVGSGAILKSFLCGASSPRPIFLQGFFYRANPIVQYFLTNAVFKWEKLNRIPVNF